MKFSPLSIKQQEFSKSMRGYETEEVQAFLEKLADEFDNLYKENEKLKRELDELNIKVAEYKRIEKNLQDTLLKAQDSTSRTMESSKNKLTSW
ncbi:MAG: DivIVA domain-containing protein [Ignavibacteriales bacterium]|nr:DivIVA domain-containing protein [Ignavibacteriales bacterium]